MILTALAENINKAKQIVKEIDRVTPQVVIEARIVEANSSFTRDFGFDWGTVQIGALNPLQIGNSTFDFELLANNLPAGNSGSVGFNFQKLTGTDFSIIDAKLQASESEGQSNVISAPKVTTLDSKEAEIVQGLKFPYLERDSSGNATTKYQEVNLSLKVKPKITLDERVRLAIKITKQDLVAQTDLGPTVSNNTANTDLIVDNGDTIVIGGIVKSTISYDETGIPGLMQMGVLGWLFKSQGKLNNKNELLIFITPRIIKLEQKI